MSFSKGQIVKRTPEQEAYRLLKLRQAIKGRPTPDHVRKKQSDAMKRAWSEGRQVNRLTPEMVAAIADKLRGRKRPPEVVEMVRRKNIGKKRTPEQIEAMRQRVIAGYAAGKYRCSDEAVERRRLAAIAANTGRVQTPEQRQHHSEMMKGRKTKPEHIEKRVAPMRGRPQTALNTAKGPTNKGSIEGALRDSSGRIWWFRNMTHFVRTHGELFDPDDLHWKAQRSGRGSMACNASKRLLCLFGRGKIVPGTWKGWTVASWGVEGANGFSDLLERA